MVQVVVGQEDGVDIVKTQSVSKQLLFYSPRTYSCVYEYAVPSGLVLEPEIVAVSAAAGRKAFENNLTLHSPYNIYL